MDWITVLMPSLLMGLPIVLLGMMQNDQSNGQQPKPPSQQMRENVNLLVGAAQCICKPIEALLPAPARGASGT